jgi:hypothetical protein
MTQGGGGEGGAVSEGTTVVPPEKTTCSAVGSSAAFHVTVLLATSYAPTVRNLISLAGSVTARRRPLVRSTSAPAEASRSKP